MKFKFKSSIIIRAEEKGTTFAKETNSVLLRGSVQYRKLKKHEGELTSYHTSKQTGPYNVPFHDNKCLFCAFSCGHLLYGHRAD